MKTLIPKFVVPVALALTLSLAAGGAANAACLDNREIQDAVSSGQIMSLAAVLAAAGIDGNTKILNVQVCDNGGQLVYKIGVLAPSGDAKNLVLNAQ
jgi:hypothetical protein